MFTSLIKHAFMTKCTDRRDKIYVVMSLAYDIDMFCLVPDHEKSPADLLFDFLTAIYEIEAQWKHAPYDYINEHSTFAERLRVELGCTLKDFSSSARFRSIGLRQRSSASILGDLSAKISWVLQEHEQDPPDQSIAQPTVLIGPSNESPWTPKPVDS